MTIAILFIAAIVLMITMVALTLGVNELEKKGSELSDLLKARYTLRQQAKRPGSTPPAAAPSQGQGGINIPPPSNRSPGRA